MELLFTIAALVGVTIICTIAVFGIAAFAEDMAELAYRSIHGEDSNDD